MVEMELDFTATATKALTSILTEGDLMQSGPTGGKFWTPVVS